MLIGWPKTTDVIGGELNLFVSFTDLDKLGINPASVFDTPLGIYAYPARFVKSATGANRPMALLPFAGGAQWANIFKVSGNIVDLTHMSEAVEQKYYDLLQDLIVKIAKPISADENNLIQQIIPRSVRSATQQSIVASLPGGRFWHVTGQVAKWLLDSKYWSGSHTSAWNKVFRLLGIDGVIDDGRGIIHQNEPSQALFFTTGAIVANERVPNSYSPDSVKNATLRGAKRAATPRANRNRTA